MRVTKQRASIALITAITAVGLTACSPSATPPSSTPAPEPSHQYETPRDAIDAAAAAPTPERTAEPSTDAADGGELGAPEKPATFDGDDQSAALEHARRALVAFQDVGNASWAEQLSPLLTPDARSLYATVNPATVPTDAVLDVQLAADSSASLAVAEAVTARGTIRILVQRQADLSWGVARFDLGGLQ